MKTLMKKTVGMMMVVTCMIGTTAFADGGYGPGENEGVQPMEVVEACSAVDMLGGIPDSVVGPDREDIEAMLNEIDQCYAVGDFERAEDLWNCVYEVLSHYEQVEPEVFEQGPQEMPLEDQIAYLEELIAYYEQRGDFYAADSLRADLEGLLEGAAMEDPDAFNDPGVFEDPDAFNDPDVFEDPDAFNDPVDIGEVVRAMEEEIQRLIDMGDYEAAEGLRSELDRILSENSQNEGFEEPDTWTPEDLLESLQGAVDPIDFEHIVSTLDEIRMLEETGNYEMAEHLKAELDAFINSIMESNPIIDPMNPGMESDIVTVDDILNKIGHELTPEKIQIIEDLVNQINEVANEEIIF